MDKPELRKKDFITSIILVLFGIWMVLYTGLTMPMKDSFSGVVNVWYVSPALFPLGIGSFIIVAGLVLMRRAIRDGGARRYFQDLSGSRRERDPSGKTLRLLGILLPIFSFVYLHIPRVDFFLSTLCCLVVFTTFFIFDDREILKKAFRFYLLTCLFFALLFAGGGHTRLNEVFPYFLDGLVFLSFLIYVLYCAALIRGNAGHARKLRLGLITSLTAALVLIPAFKFFLLVPLPVEGGFIELMSIVRYAFR